jgi:hypothetical protein
MRAGAVHRQRFVHESSASTWMCWRSWFTVYLVAAMLAADAVFLLQGVG